jgi:hypothetical protein
MSGTGGSVAGTCSTPGTCASCSINLNNKLTDLSPNAIGSCISTYGANIATSAAQRAALQPLGLHLYRVPIRWNGGNPVSSAGGGPQNISADDYISALTSIGANAVIVVGGETGDNDFTPSDAANLVQRYSTKGVKYYFIGNEPNNQGISIQNYASLFNDTATAMRNVDPNILIGGPTWSWYSANDLDTFMDLSGSHFDVLDYHHYAMGNPPALSDDQALANTKDWGDEVGALYTKLQQKGLQGKQVSVGEYNWAWQFNDGIAGGDLRFYQPIITVWASSLIGHAIGHAGWVFQYSDQNGPLGLTVEPGNGGMGQPGNSPLPIFHGLGMWTGEGLFRGFGSQFYDSSCDDPLVEVFATSGPNVVVVNKAKTDREALINIGGGVASQVSVWQTGSDPFAAPTKVLAGNVSAAGVVDVAIPALSVSTLVFN